MLSIVLVVIGLSWTAVELVTVTPEFKKLFIDTHNQFRRDTGSSNMQYLGWDDDLAREAAAWARRCVYKHKKGQGENLAFNTNKMSDLELIKDAMNMWYGERKDYNYNSLSCRKICSHYTDLVWAITTKFGCGIEKCHKSLGFYTVCFYRPVGNWVGQYPYLTGNACSRCNPGQYCDNKLCRGVSTKNMTTGIGPRGECADQPKYSSQCAAWKHSCASNKGFMETNCPKTCGFCTSGGSPAKPTNCADNPIYSSRCNGWKYSCTSNRGFMETNCPKTCGFCSGGVTPKKPTNCADNPIYSSRCNGWKYSCTSNRGFMETNCPKTCGFCSGGSTPKKPTNCEDSPEYRSRCSGWKWSCVSNAGFMKLHCKKSCGLCR